MLMGELAIGDLRWHFETWKFN